MGRIFDHVFIIADIEGSSGCADYEASSYLTATWPEACLAMTKDVAAVTDALLEAGVGRITVKDFHRTGYNIFREMLDPRVRLVSGYIMGPVPGMGKPGPAGALMMTGMHAPSGSGGFLAHTLTSRISRLSVNGSLVSEAQLFSASLAPFGFRPIFFSGCPVACEQAAASIPNLQVYAIIKRTDGTLADAADWRKSLAEAAVSSLDNEAALPYEMKGPFEVELVWRDGEGEASVLAARWGLGLRGDTLLFRTSGFDDLYRTLIRVCYMTPLVERILPAGLPLYNLAGRWGLSLARRALRKRVMYRRGRETTGRMSGDDAHGAGPCRG